MTEKIIKYKADGRDYDVYESEVSKFLETYPNATIRASVDDRNYDVFPSEMEDFLKVYPNASYTVDNPSSAITDTNYEPTLPDADEDAPEMSRRERRQARREERREARRNDDRPSWGESAAKGVGAGFTRTGKGLLDALHQLSAGMLYNDPETGEAKRLESYDTQMQDNTNTFRNASVLASETAEELSREADPTGGDKGFVDLIAEGKIGVALQKGLATGAESLPMTLSAYNPWTMALNAISMAGANYAEETLDNPEIDPWKRAVKAIGSAAIEQAVEKFADPVFKYIGGGKGAGELTEELAKELVERGTKEATENIAKRIFRVLKNTAKDAAGEGIEEVVTSFGNDALGQALDWIDGDNDYGIRAQWEQMKSENPDADAWDFALAKGKEYMDSFIGGALSGGYMSGTANVFSEGAKFKYDRDARKTLDESRAVGSSLDYGDMYDSDDTVKEQIDAVAATFTNENGEASISGEFIGTLSSEDAFALSRRNDFTPEQRNALFGLARAKAIQEGLTTKLDERLESQINANKVLIEAATENGSIITAMYGGKPVYVMGAWNKGDGTVTAPSGQNGPVMVVDAMTGEKSYARSEDIQFAESKNPDEYAREIEVMLRENDARNRQVAQSTMSVRAKAKAVKPFAGKKILVDVGNGLAEVLVQQISPNGDVIIKGKKGDLGGQSVMTLSADVFYDSIYRDEDGNPVITEAPQEAEAETPQEEAPIAEVTGDEDYRGQTIPILLNGVPTEVEVMSQDNPSDSIVYEYTDASGNRRTASSTIGAFNAAIQQAAEYVAPTETPAEETLPVETVPADSETQAPQEVPVTPENIDWDALFEQDPEAYFVELQNQFGEEALDILNEEIVAAQEELDSLNKKRGKTQNERLENRKKKVTLQNRIDTLKGMVARLTAPAVETPAVPEATEVPATEVPADVAPVTEPVPTEVTPPVSETPAEPVEETPAVPESTEPAPVEQTPAVEPQPTAQPEAVPTEAEPEPTEQPAEETPTEAEPEPTPTPAPAPTPSKPTTQGGAIARMIGEAKKQIAKLAAKANIKDFTVDDNVRPVFGGVFRKGGYEYASDSHILAKIKAQYPSEQEEKIYSVKTGQEIKGRFPNADWVISSVERVNTEIEANVDDILAAAQAAEELKKGLDKYKKIYVKVGRSIFDSSYLLKAARMAKQQGLTKVTQHPTEHRAMLFAGENGVVLIMSMNGSAIPNKDIIDAKTGEATFGGFTTVSVKTPSSLKGIETARNTLEAIIPNSTEDEIENLKNSNTIELVDGKVVYRFNTADIVSAKNKAKDPNTYAALEAIEKNGLEIPLSSSEIAKLFPESVAPAVPSTAEGTPIAPNPVANPAREAQKREKALAQQLQRYGISPEQKQDMAFNAGKAVGDFFATREEYDAYAENATDLGDYNEDFERGVEASFANRQQNVGNSPVNSVPLETEPNEENNGEAATEESGTGQSDSGSVRQTSDGGGQEANQGALDAEPSQGKNKSGSKTKQVASKYPVRKGNATQKLLKDTFCFESVTIPNSRKDTLNAIYDFMMEMSKMLGISPKSIGQGGMLGVGSLNARARATAEHSLRRNKFSLDFINASINFKYAKLEGIAHEWWHALDYALGYFDSSKVYGTTTEMSDRQFSGRKETYDAVQAVMQAIKDSGYPARIRSLTNSRAALKYYLDPTEMAARAFDGYLRDMFAAAGISIEGASYDYIDTDPSQQTPDEMAVIAPAFDNLFKVLQEKEGKTPGTSVLYHIGEMMAEDSPAKRLATDAVLTALDDTSIDVVRATDKQTQQMLDIMDEVAEMQKGTAPETALPEDESSFKGTAISSADGAKIINNLDNLIIEYSQKPKNNVKTFIGDVARALEIDKRELPESSQKSRYATFEAKNGKIFTLRIANHNATVSFFDGNNESEGISVVISRTPNEGVANDGDAHIIEFFYKESDIVKSDGQPLVEILKSIKQSLYSGEYKDSTGLAKPQEVNAPELFKTPNGTVYGWTDGKKIYLTKAGINPNTPIHEYTHLWAKAMMQRNPKGWNSIKKLLKGTPVWNQVMNDPNYSSIHNDEDAVASEALSRISGTENAAKMEQMAQQMIDDAKGTARKLEARGLVQNMRDALNKFWKWVGTNLFGIEKFKSVEQITDRVLFDLLNNTDLGELSEGQVETQIVTDPEVIAELEASPKRTGYRNVVQNEDGTFSSPMAYWLQGTKEGAKSRVETAKFELGKWEEAEEHPELVDEKGHVVLVKPNKSTVEVAYDPYIHNRLDPVNLQFKDAWKRDELVYVETVVPETDLESGYHADQALLPVGVHSWSNGDVMLSKYDKPVRIMPWDAVADAWVERLDGNGVHFDVVPPALRSFLVERGVEILPPHKGMGKDCNDAYEAWKKENEIALSRKGKINANFVEQFEFKQNNERQELEYSDEFRRLQEESARMSEQLVSEYHRRQRGNSEGIRRRLGEIFQRELESRAQRGANKWLSVVNESKGTSFDIIENIDGRMFHDIFAIVRNYLPNGELVDLHDNYDDAICYITSDGLAGFAVDKDGNLISVYSFYGNSKRGFLGAIKDLVTQAGATHLDGYNSSNQRLAEIYSKAFGWKVASMMDYNMEYDHDNIAENHGMPQVAFMVNSEAEIPTRHFNEDQYDEAVEYQLEQVEISQRVDSQNAAIDNLAGEPRLRAIEHAVSKEAAKLGVNVTYASREDMPRGHKNDKGYYNTKTGEIVICTENASSIADAIQTILHEAVAHKGLRQLMGDRFNEFISRVYESLDAETKAKVDALAAASYNGNTAVAMEEYIASLAETTDFDNNSVWSKIKSIFEDIINAILGRNDIKIGDNELRYILRASYNNMVNPRFMESTRGWAQDQMMREEYAINEATPEILSRTGIDPSEVATETARQVYSRTVQARWQEAQRQFQDAMQPVRIAIDAIQQETGNIPIEDYENYLLIKNQASSRSRVEIDNFQRRYFSPVVEQVNKIIDQIMESRGWNVKDKSKRTGVYSEVKQYLIAKHGLERNELFRSTKGEDRDYSGLTALFGLEAEEYVDAERMAQELVDNFENEVSTDELWAKINAATNKTLRHSYECGLLSRSQYEQIRDMFEFYIPLRGFDETTAEDVYSYLRFESNSFSPAVKEAKGRTSIADDPLAYIMTMAESEITQGNNNRAKQALFNFLINRASATGKQNTLMQVEDVWYVKSVDGNGVVTQQIAAPNHAAGETYEEFEARMQALEATGDAFKSKKGQVDVGMRFQVKRNQNAHYIYLKVNGVEKAIYINGDPKAADAINGRYAEKPGRIEEKMREANRLISSTFTNYSLEFTLRNFTRDMIYANINLAIKEPDPAYRRKFRRNWAHNNMGAMIKMLQAYRSGEFEGRTDLNEDEAAFVEFMENGGQTGYTLINSVESRKKDLERAIKRMQNGIDKGGVKDSTVFRYTLGGIELLNEASELVTRFAAFKTSRDMGRSILRSVSDAKEITVNFNTKGAQDGKGWMGMLAKWFGATRFFFNASVQGIQNVKAMANANKFKFGGVVAGLVASGFLMPILQGMLIELLGGDDDWYWDIPEYDRQSGICIVIGEGKYVKIPLPVGLNKMYAIGDTVASWVFDKKHHHTIADVGMEVANLVASTILPVNPLEGTVNELSLMQSVVNAVAPSSAQAVIQNLTNTDWKGAPIQKEYTYNRNDPQWEKAYSSNPAVLKALSKWCYENVKLDGWFRGWDWSPEYLDNTLSNLGGGIYSLIKKTGNAISMIWNEDARELSKVPLVGVFFGTTDDRFGYVNEAYYDLDEEFDSEVDPIKKTAKAFGYSLDEVFKPVGEGGKRAGDNHPKMQKDVYGNRHFEHMQAWYLGQKKLESINDEIEKQEKKMAKIANPPRGEIDKMTKLQAEYETTRTELVNGMLESKYEQIIDKFRK